MTGDDFLKFYLMPYTRAPPYMFGFICAMLFRNDIFKQKFKLVAQNITLKYFIYAISFVLIQLLAWLPREV